MDELIVPATPQWYRPNIFVCAPDNTLVYGSKNDIVVVKRTPAGEPEIKTIPAAHSRFILTVGLNKKWAEPNKYAVSVAEDNVIRVWNLETLEKKSSNNVFGEQKHTAVGAVFAGEDRIVSVTENGIVLIWNIVLNESKLMSELLRINRCQITCLSSCPHAGHLTAFGLSDGCVIVADLRREGHVMYKMRGHDRSITSLSWCPAPINVFPKRPHNKVGLLKVTVDEPSPVAKLDQQPPKVESSVAEPEVETTDNKVETIDEVPHKDEQQDVPSVDDESRVIVKTEPSEPEPEEPVVDEPEKVRVEVKSETKLASSSTTTSDEPESSELEEQKQQGAVKKTENRSILRAKKKKSSRKRPDGAGDAPPAAQPEVGDFLADCNSLRNQILGIAQPAKTTAADDEKGEEKVDLPENRDKDDRRAAENEPHTVQNREMPQVFDHSCDFFDNVAEEPTSVPIKIEFDFDDEPAKENVVDQSKGESVEVESEERSVEVEPIVKGGEHVESRGDRRYYGEKRDESHRKPRGGNNRRERRKSREESGDERPRTRRIVECVEEEPRTEYLLASASKDKKIFVWRGGTDGRMQTFFPVPRKYRSEFASNNNYIAVCWATPTQLLVSTLNGDIVTIQLPKVENAPNVLIHKKHYNSTVFNIVTPMRYYTASDWQDKYPLQIWSHDTKSIVYYDGADKSGVCLDLHTITANVTCLASSPLDPNRVAVGYRDCFVHTWDLSTTKSVKNRMPTYSKKLRGKVSALAWHPTKEMVLGFGTDEGAVGIVEGYKPTERRDFLGKTTTLRYFFRTEVYKVEWGPITGNKTYLGLYAVAEGKLVIYDVAQPKAADPIVVQLPDKNMYLYKFAWKPDYSCLLLAMKDGSVVVLNTDLQIVSTLYLDDKAFNLLAWHPEAAESDVGEFPFCNWFAAATTKGVLLYDCCLALQKDATNEQLLEKKCGFLDGHLKPVTALAWSPFKTNLLVTTSSDGLVHVWDVLEKTVISTYVDKFFSQITAVMWSPSNPDLVILGEKQIAMWNITKHEPKVAAGKLDNVEDDDVTEFMTEHKKALQKVAVTIKSEAKDKDASLPKTVVLSGEDRSRVEIPKTIKLSKKSIVPTIYTASDDNAELQIANMRKLLNEDAFDDNDPMNLFGSQANVLDLLTANRELHKRDYKTQYSDLIALYKGDAAICVKEAIQDNRVTPFVISLAPMVSTKLWQEACELYAKSLSEEASPNFLHAAGYYLMCNKIEQAVDCLCDGSLYREALALAKCRFPKDSSIVFKVTYKWAKDCFDQGNYELAAYCYISIAQYAEAARALAKRNKPEVLEFALELATKAESGHVSAMISSKLNEIKNASAGGGIKSSRLEAMLDKNAEEDAKDGQSNSITASCDDGLVQSSDEKDLEQTPVKNVSLDAPSESSGVDSGRSPSSPDSSICHNSSAGKEDAAEASLSSREDEEAAITSTKVCKID